MPEPVGSGGPPAGDGSLAWFTGDVGLLERWDERNQAWADHQRAKPYPPPPSRLGSALVLLGIGFFTVRFAAAVVHREWLTVGLSSLVILPVAWGLLQWVRERSSA